ncbi:hypothetical protein GUJ93_ZPchr0006g46151 [Zizania palustris]|uniref:Uncharacterized protein n=1 Tax=Zizania palustris TaxID=103762 RepID=A0A8J5SLH3_ZIZPA|nr:hypothetical protein GUJ93_ZPchr0006g46151 [Zizania palustris]
MPPPRPPAATAASARLPGFPPPPRAYALRLCPPPAASRHLRHLRPPPRLPAAYAASARLRPPSRRLRAPWSPTRQAEEKEEKSQSVPDAVVAILGSFDSRLSALDAAMRPIQVRTHAVRTAHENIDRTLRSADVILIQFDRTREPAPSFNPSFFRLPSLLLAASACLPGLPPPPRAYACCLRPPRRPPAASAASAHLPSFLPPPRPPAATAASARLPGFPPPPRAYALRLCPPPAASRHLRRLRPPPRLPAAYAASARLRPPSRRLRAPWSPTRQAEEKEEKSQSVPDAVVAILGSFDSRLSALDAAMRPIQVRTHAVRTAHENIDRTLRSADVILIQFDRTRERSGVRSAGPSTVPFSFSQEFTPHILLLGGFDVSPGYWSMQL